MKGAKPLGGVGSEAQTIEHVGSAASQVIPKKPATNVPTNPKSFLVRGGGRALRDKIVKGLVDASLALPQLKKNQENTAAIVFFLPYLETVEELSFEEAEKLVRPEPIKFSAVTEDAAYRWAIGLAWSIFSGVIDLGPVPQDEITQSAAYSFNPSQSALIMESKITPSAANSLLQQEKSGTTDSVSSATSSYYTSSSSAVFHLAQKLKFPTEKELNDALDAAVVKHVIKGIFSDEAMIITFNVKVLPGETQDRLRNILLKGNIEAEFTRSIYGNESSMMLLKKDYPLFMENLKKAFESTQIRQPGLKMSYTS